MTEEQTEMAPPAEEVEEELKKPKKACCGCFPEKKPEEEKRKIPFCNIFRFAGKIEILLLTIGILFNAATGCAVVRVQRGSGHGRTFDSYVINRSLVTHLLFSGEACASRR
eukprot:GHVU01231869.1.p1 GENE.GHVU01231869.1~~GHVU01231869.1.p1  ORF type:complete len:111 (+),score=14.46 GHVU01231869.1:214-546(+)